MKTNINFRNQNKEMRTNDSSIVYYGEKQKAIMKSRATNGSFTNFVKSYIWILISVITIIGLASFVNYMNNQTYYNNLFQIEPLQAESRLFGGIKSLILDIVLWVPRFIVIQLSRVIIFPVVDTITLIILWLLKGGILKTILNTMLFSDSPNIFKTAMLAIFILGAVVFVISLSIMFLRQMTSLEEKDFGLIIKNSFKSAFLFFFAYFLFIFMYILTSLGTMFLLSFVGKGQKFSTIIVGINFVGGSTLADSAVEHMYSIKPLDPNTLFEYDIMSDTWTWDLESALVEKGDIGYEWWIGGGKDFYVNAFGGDSIMTREEWNDYVDRFDKMSWDWTQKAYAKLSGFCSVIGIVVSGVIMLVLLTIFFIQLFVRVFKITGLLLIAPYPSAVSVLDGGEKFKEWQKNSFETFMEVFLFSILLIIFIGTISLLPQFYDDFENNLFSGNWGQDLIVGATSWILPLKAIFNISIMCGAGYAVVLLPAEFNGIIGSIGALLGAKMLSNTIKKGVKVGGAIASGGATAAATLSASSGLTDKLVAAKDKMGMGEDGKITNSVNRTKGLFNGDKKEAIKGNKESFSKLKAEKKASLTGLKDKEGMSSFQKMNAKRAIRKTHRDGKRKIYNTAYKTKKTN